MPLAHPAAQAPRLAFSRATPFLIPRHYLWNSATALVAGALLWACNDSITNPRAGVAPPAAPTPTPAPTPAPAPAPSAAPWATASVGDVLSWHWPTATGMGPFTDPTLQGPGEIVANPLGPGYCWRRDITAGTSDASYELNAEFASRKSAWVRFWYYQPLGDPQNPGTMKMVRFREQGFGNEYGTFDIQRNSYVFFGLNNVNTLSNVGSIPTPNQNRGAWHEFLVHYDILKSGEPSPANLDR